MKTEFKADRVCNIFIVIPTIEIYLEPKGIWYEGNQGIGFAIRWGFWAVGVRIFKAK